MHARSAVRFSLTFVLAFGLLIVTFLLVQRPSTVTALPLGTTRNYPAIQLYRPASMAQPMVM